VSEVHALSVRELSTRLASPGRNVWLLDVRSEAAARYFEERGFNNVWNVVGGIDAWSREIDPRVPRY
jgi:rhodanese-related sulfurtransferase